MGGSASTVKVPIPDFVWLTEVPFIRIADKTTAEVCLTVNATCCARLLLTQDGGEDKLATDFLLQENTEKTITLQGLKPGCLYRAHFLYRGSLPRGFFLYLCVEENKRKKRDKDIKCYFLQEETKEEISLLRKARKYPLLAIRQPSTFPSFYEIKTLPQAWGTPTTSIQPTQQHYTQSHQQLTS